jgi:glucose-1-phosphate thymidylyltransferase
MLAGIRDILIVTNPNEEINFQKILGNGSMFGIKITYINQDKPNGLPEAFIIGEKFINNQDVALILGDNFFYGQGFTKKLIQQTLKNKGATIFLYQVNNPQDYGIVEIKNKKIISIKEKPKFSNSKLAITGLYFFDKKVINFSKKLKPSKRGELEMVDLFKKYLKINKLNVNLLGRGSAWLDTGTIKNLFQTTEFISSIEERQGLKIACLEEIGLKNRWIEKKSIKRSIKFYGKCEYSNYLKSLI